MEENLLFLPCRNFLFLGPPDFLLAILPLFALLSCSFFLFYESHLVEEYKKVREGGILSLEMKSPYIMGLVITSL